ncbi:Glycosylphosphatidylinositol (GPI) anchor assembly protein [Ascosphaera acerosa]|nr:Glycosylphosphatidylinositol (GPI) anchor assembly protein [Ascosphaera acerosa]
MPATALPTPAARLYAASHPLLLLALFAASFDQLVKHTTETLSASLLPLAVFQSIYLSVGLPPASSTSSSASEGDSKDRRGRHAQISLSQRISTSLLSHTIVLILGTPLLSILAVTFGAPLTTHCLETALLAAHMSLLAGSPLVYVHGMDGKIWLEIASLNRPWDALWGGSLGVLVGAWAGAVPIPLDWDRPWQAYPITILAGAYAGYAAFSLLGRCPGVYGKQLAFTDTKTA